jgi:hypothetical protein
MKEIEKLIYGFIKTMGVILLIMLLISLIVNIIDKH